jgi:hypothetical protein
MLLMKKSIPDSMFTDRDQVRLSMLQGWVLDHGVTEIVMTERQFWRFVSAQPVAEKPWATYMGRIISVPDMPEASQRHLGLFDRRLPGQI